MQDKDYLKNKHSEESKQIDEKKFEKSKGNSENEKMSETIEKVEPAEEPYIPDFDLDELPDLE